MTTVDTSCGKIRGDCTSGIYAFRGIPYAEPLAGAARWLPPVPRRPWTGVRDARRYGDACLQFRPRSALLPFPAARRRYFEAINGLLDSCEGDDCLVLNVWSPTLDVSARLPVMVWIHGGSFTSGVANGFYDGTALACHNVVAVAIQYRLGPLGFLHGAGLFEGQLCADNRGFLDQLAALRWVRENIACFGGDPDNVTVFGESAGAVATYLLAASPLSKGLFRRVIAMGGMPGPSAPAQEHHQLSRDALRDVGVLPGDQRALVALDRPSLVKLQAAIFRRILRAAPDQYGSISRRKIIHLGVATETDFLPQPPLENYRAGTPNRIDLLLGTCRNDGALFSLSLPIGRYLSARIFASHIGGLIPNGDLASLLAHYRAHMPGASLGAVYEQINNDACFRMPTIDAAEAHAAAHPGQTWLYQLNCESAIPGLGAVHGIDVALLFRTAPGVRLLREDAESLCLTLQMREVVTTFARTGRPAAVGLPKWAPYGPTDRATMMLSRYSRLVFNLDAPLRRYWNDAK